MGIINNIIFMLDKERYKGTFDKLDMSHALYGG